MKFFKFKVHRTDKKAYDVLTWTVETEIQRKAPELQMKQSLSQPKFESNLNWPVATKPCPFVMLVEKTDHQTNHTFAIFCYNSILENQKQLYHQV